MSPHPHEDTLPAGTHDESPPARKRAVKKTAAKKTAVAKKAAVKKPAVARKTAAKKTAAEPAAVVIQTVIEDAPKKRAPRVKKAAATEAPADVPARQDPTPSGEPKRFGRVPGGGPIAPREAPAAAEPAPAAPTPPPNETARPNPSPSEPRQPRGNPPRNFQNRDNQNRDNQNRDNQNRDNQNRDNQNRDNQNRDNQNRDNQNRDNQNRDNQNRDNQNRDNQNRDNQNRDNQNRDNQNRDNQNRDNQNRDNQNRDNQNREGQVRDSRSKRRRDKRKNRNERQAQGKPPEAARGDQCEAPGAFANDRRPAQITGPKIETNGMLELAPKGFGFLRLPAKNFEQLRDDVFVTPESIRRYNLRVGQWIHGIYQEGPRGPQLVEITAVNGMPPEEAAKLPHFDELKAINPTRRISFETTPERFTTRVVDIMAPVGRGQRGLIVSPPRSGKTTLMLHMAEAIREKYDEAIHLMVLLVDERPEEVTEFRRTLPGAEIYASSNDELPRNHCRIAELAIERAKRLVEAGQDVFLLMDSITRLARAYNNTMNNRGRGTGSGGITIGALEIPRRLFAAARNTRGGGSLTILATALIQTNSRADEAIFMEFKGTGNMELVLDRKIAENYIYPAVDIFKSGTRREELLIPEHMLHKIHLIRRGLSGHRPVEAMERLLFFLKKFSNNPQMLLEIKG